MQLFFTGSWGGGVGASFHRRVVTLVDGIINPNAVGFHSEQDMAASNLSIDKEAIVHAVVLEVSSEWRTRITPCC